MTRPRRARMAAIIVASAVVIVVGVVGALIWAGSRQEGPEAVAREWLLALADGDHDAARAAMITPPEAAGVPGAAETPSDPSVDAVRIDGDTAEADVSFALAGEVHEASVTLSQTPEGWLVGADGLGEVEISTSVGDSVTIGETVVPAGEITLLPGLYDVAAAPRDYLDGSAAVSVIPGGMEALAIDATFNDAAYDAVREALADHLEACTQPAATVADYCGLRVPWPADIALLDRIAYRIDRLPEVELTDDGGFAATGGVVVATASGTGRDGSPAAVTYRDDAWAVRGTVTVTGEQIRLDVL